MRLSHSGRFASRDIVQFVPFARFSSSPALLAQETLAEVPRQVRPFPPPPHLHSSHTHYTHLTYVSLRYKSTSRPVTSGPSPALLPHLCTTLPCRKLRLLLFEAAPHFMKGACHDVIRSLVTSPSFSVLQKSEGGQAREGGLRPCGGWGGQGSAFQ